MAASGPLTESRHAVAPAWHTGIVLFALVVLSQVVAHFTDLPFVGIYGRGAGYVWIALLEWVIVGFIHYGVNRSGTSLRDLIGGKWLRPVMVLRDVAVSLGFLVIIFIISQGLAYLLNAEPNQAVRNLIPRSSSEVVLFLMLTLTAGFCEEVIYRGYLRCQFAALTRSVTGGILLQAITFGAGHTYQGWKFVLIISVLGTMFGLLAHWRRSLRPGMAAHFLQDGIGGVLAWKFLN